MTISSAAGSLLAHTAAYAAHAAETAGAAVTAIAPALSGDERAALSSWKRWTAGGNSSTVTSARTAQFKKATSNLPGDYLQAKALQRNTLLRFDDCESTQLPALPAKLRTLRVHQARIKALPKLPDSVRSLEVVETKLRQLVDLPGQLQTLHAPNNRIVRVGELPPRLARIDLSSNELKSLGPLPKKITYAQISGNQLKELPQLPRSLRELFASDNLLTKLPELPPVLRTLDVSRNRLKFVKDLPPTLTQLNLSQTNLRSIPQLPPKLVLLRVSKNGLRRLPTLPRTLDILDAAENKLDEIGQLPQRLTQLNLAENQLERPPQLPGGLQELDMHGNRLRSLPELPASLARLDIRKNRLRSMPEQLYRHDLVAEVDIRDNPLSLADIRALRIYISDRRDEGHATIRLTSDDSDPALDAEAEKIHHLRGLKNTDVHTTRVVNVFRSQLDTLVSRFPDVAADNRAIDYPKLQQTLLADFSRCEALYPDLMKSEFPGYCVPKLAAQAVETMCSHAIAGEKVMDFGDYTAGHVLAYVHRRICHENPEARDPGIVQLMQHLSFARGNNKSGEIFCPTRHVEEAISSLQSAYDDMPRVPFSEALDVFNAVGKTALKRLLDVNPALTDQTLRMRFSATLRAELLDHPNIDRAHTRRYLSEFAFAEWDTYREMATLGDSQSSDFPT